MKTAIETIYKLREKFEVIALTGYEGSGCSYLANEMSKDSTTFLSDVRKKIDIEMPEPDTTNNAKMFVDQTNNYEYMNALVFSRKFAICRNYYEHHYKNYTVIKYGKVVWLYTLLYFKKIAKDTKVEFTVDFIKEKLIEILQDKYMSSRKRSKEDSLYSQSYPNYSKEQLLELINQLSIENLPKEIDECYEDDFCNIRGEKTEPIARIFINPESCISKFYDSINVALIKKDYYRHCYLYHRLATIIRASGNPLKSTKDIDDNPDYSNVYCIVDLINVILKGIKFIDKDNRRVVIDSIRNSIEATYLKERYHSFYMIAVHSDERDENIKTKIDNALEEKMQKELTFNPIRWLTDIEAISKDYENGKIAHPNTEMCIADAEIHITNNKEEKPGFCFTTIKEQWMKYASLIYHPGLITPSADEHCMSVAYLSRLNSSCVSRQVGAVITNKDHAIRSIGWNDVAYGQVPCGLRDLREIRDYRDDVDGFNFMYSDFERGEEKRYNGKCFRECLKEDYPSKEYSCMEGYSMPYCFRTLDNRYYGEANQTQTRSLHAEENAMMQMVKYGGESLRNGIIYVTASPCELCSKKLYQIGIRRIIYIDDYPGIANDNITHSGIQQPELQKYKGAYGDSYIKLFRPFISRKDEISMRTKGEHSYKSSKVLLKKILESKNIEVKNNYTDGEIVEILQQLRINK